MKINKVLGIAINDYDDERLNEIQNCQKDVSSLISILNEKYDIEDVEFIYKKSETTRKAIFNKLNDYFINRLEDENVLLIYAGHGEYNEILNTAYWQPSDAEVSDSSTWISIDDILKFIKASKAFHIGIICDSCFSGAILEPPTRGGGVYAFNSKKSRLALTAGGLERVSDGQKGQFSPFAEALMKILKENTQEELPLSQIGPQLLLNFNPETNQTPMFGTLKNVGDEGGSFIFKLKSEKKEPSKHEDKNEFLEGIMANLFIPISEVDLSLLSEIKRIKDLKIESVKKQDFESAANFRFEEKELEAKISDNLPSYVESILSPEAKIFSDNDIERSKELDNKIKKYNEEIEHDNINTPIENKTTEYGNEENKVQINIGEEIFFRKLIYRLSHPINPAEKLFNSEQENLFKAYKENIVSLYEYFFKMKCKSTNEFFNQKETELKEILIEIYHYELGLLTKGYKSELDEIMRIRELDIRVLNWITNK